jgi:hypothetical protein
MTEMMCHRLILSLRSLYDQENALHASSKDMPYISASRSRTSFSGNGGVVQVQIQSCARLSDVREDTHLDLQQALYYIENESSPSEKIFNNLRLKS